MGEELAMTAVQSVNGSVAAVVLDRAEWGAAVLEFGDYGYRQAWAYGETLARRRGATSEHVAIRRGDETLALADVRIKRLPVVGGGLAYVSGGPLVRRLDDPGYDLERFGLAIDALVHEYVRRRGLTLRVLAPIGLPEWNEAAAGRLEAAGLRHTDRGEHYRTVLLDVDRPADELRASFHRHWRRHLNGAERNGLEVTFGTGADRFEQVARMSEALRARKGFHLELDAGFFADVQRELDGDDRLVVGIVSRDGEPLAGNITAIHGDTAVYLVGASTDAALECKASYLMHWRTIELLQERGVPWYDLGGIDPDVNPGVTSFKLRTNGIDVTAAGPYEAVPAGPRGQLTDWAERAYARAREARAR